MAPWHLLSRASIRKLNLTVVMRDQGKLTIAADSLPDAVIRSSSRGLGDGEGVGTTFFGQDNKQLLDMTARVDEGRIVVDVVSVIEFVIKTDGPISRMSWNGKAITDGTAIPPGQHQIVIDILRAP